MSRAPLTGEALATRRRIGGRIGGLRSWANTPDREARLQAARRAGPGTVEYWLARLDPERFAGATDEQRLAAAEAARRAHYAELALRSAQSRARSKARRDVA